MSRTRVSRPQAQNHLRQEQPPRYNYDTSQQTSAAGDYALLDSTGLGATTTPEGAYQGSTSADGADPDDPEWAGYEGNQKNSCRTVSVNNSNEAHSVWVAEMRAMHLRARCHGFRRMQGQSLSNHSLVCVLFSGVSLSFVDPPPPPPAPMHQCYYLGDIFVCCDCGHCCKSMCCRRCVVGPAWLNLVLFYIIIAGISFAVSIPNQIFFVRAHAPRRAMVHAS